MLKKSKRTKPKPQIFLIHGGMTFDNKKNYQNYLRTREISLVKKISWSGEYLHKKLGRDCEIIQPRFPLEDDAKYADWKVYFERFFPYFRPGLILIGSSLGGMFLARYLSENRFPKPLRSVYMVCPPFDRSGLYEDLAGGFRLRPDLSLIEKNCSRVNLLFSRNDDIVPVAHAAKYAKKLKKARIIIFPNIKGHFKIAEFPEIIKMIREDLKKKYVK
jgi:predicted alpha/beta hydrolase family esterase